MTLNIYTDNESYVIACDELDAIALFDKEEGESYLENGGTVMHWEVVPGNAELTFLDFNKKDGLRVTAIASDLIKERGRCFLFSYNYVE